MMVSTYALIEQIHSLPKRKKDNLGLENKLERFIDILTIRVHHKDLEQVSNDLLDDLLEIRIRGMKFLLENYYDYDTNDFLNEISPFLYSSYEDLNTTFNQVMSTYFKIASIGTTANINFGSFFKNMEIDSSISYTGLKKLVQLYPVPNILNFLKWLENSLKMEIGMFICYLIKDKTIQVPNNKFIKELQSFLISKLELFGSYAMILNIWQPSENDDTQLIRNIKIVTSAYELDAKKGRCITSQDLQKLLLVA